MIVIFNPTAGRRRSYALWRVLDVLSANGMRLELAETQHAGHATELAREAVRRGATLVVAAGGDGTIAEVANGMAGGQARLGVIPLGTANVLAHELGLPFAPRAVAAALAFGRTCLLWPGIAEGPGETRLFVQMLGVGLDAQVVHSLSPPLKRLLGKGAYVAQTMREMSRYRFPRLRLRLDGAEMEAASVIVSKGRLYAGRFTLAPRANACQPGFSVALFERYGPMAAMMYGAALPLNLLPRMPGLRICMASAVEILGDGYAQADGDPAGAAPPHHPRRANRPSRWWWGRTRLVDHNLPLPLGEDRGEGNPVRQLLAEIVAAPSPNPLPKGERLMVPRVRLAPRP